MLKNAMFSTLGSIILHLYISLLIAYLFTLWERRFSGMKRPPFQGPMTFLICLFRISPFTFLVAMKVDFKVTPRKSKWSDLMKKPWGIIACVSSVLHSPSGRNLHFLDSIDLCIVQPDAFSKIVITLSMSRSSNSDVTAGFTSSQYA